LVKFSLGKLEVFSIAAPLLKSPLGKLEAFSIAIPLLKSSLRRFLEIDPLLFRRKLSLQINANLKN